MEEETFHFERIYGFVFWNKEEEKERKWGYDPISINFLLHLLVLLFSLSLAHPLASVRPLNNSSRVHIFSFRPPEQMRLSPPQFLARYCINTRNA